MKRPIGISIALFCVLVTLAGTLGFMACGTQQMNTNGSLASPSPSAALVDCTTQSPDAILKAIYDELAKSKYADQEWQFNITVDANKVISIKGYSAGQADIINIVKTVAPACSMSSNMANTFTNSFCNMPVNFRLIRTCPQGYYPCGDVCIMQGEPCKITSEGPTSSINTNTNTTANRCANSTMTPTPSPIATAKANSNTTAP